MIAEADFENLLRDAIGLDPASVGNTTIKAAVRLRMTALGITDTETYWNTLTQSEDEFQELIESVVVPETWFFREPEAFAVLPSLIKQHWLPNNPSGKLRLLSCPCCTGEEPYSIAMALLDAGFASDRIEIDAVDISARALSRAKRGVYGLNSFRGDQLSFRDRHFEKIDKEFRLSKTLRKMVTFQKANLLSAGLSTEISYDVIFCRNVLIYFDANTQQRVLKMLSGLLAADGFLFVGPAEAFLAATSGFRSMNQSMSFAFRKSTASESPATILRPMRSKVGKISCKNLPGKVVHTPLLPIPVPIETVLSTDCLEEARRLADAGQLAEASELCELQLKRKAPSPELYYLLGLLRDSMGEFEIAAQHYRKALYLEPNHHETMIHLALLSEQMGDKAMAHKLRERARRAATHDEK